MLGTRQGEATAPRPTGYAAAPRARPMTLRLVPLGGLGQIGMNCMAIEQGEDLILVDCGVGFPHEPLGAELMHPRFDYVLERRKRLRGVVITHGHEDHIGALPYLLDLVEVPIFSPAHAAELIRRRLSEWHFQPDALSIHETRPRERFSLGSFEIEPIRVTHSIADATALAIRTEAGIVIHSGDFKLDPDPPDGELTDEARLSELGDEGVRLLLSDSTSIGAAGSAGSERAVAEQLRTLVQSSPKRALLGLFASNVQRLTMVADIARSSGRKVVLLGRGVNTHVRAATAVGRLDWPSDLVTSPEHAMTLPREKVLVLATGTQAEARAALFRLAADEHPRMRLEAGDRAIFSSRVIPGNERAVVELHNALLRRGIELCTASTHPGVHASGHAHHDELGRMIELTCPKALLPVHGTLLHLHRHAALGRSLGVEQVMVAEDGDVIELTRDAPLVKAGRAPVGRVFVADQLAIADEVLRARRQLAMRGVLSVAARLDASGAAVTRPQASQVGVIGELEVDVLAQVENAVWSSLQASLDSSPAERAEAARVAARGVVFAHTGQSPLVVVQLLGAPP